MNKKHLLLALLAGFVTLLLSACSQPPPEPTAAREHPPAETIALEPTATEEAFTPVFEEASCPFERPEEAAILCGFVVVPEDHFSYNDQTLRIAVVVFKDESPGHQPDPVILLAGGPGE